MAGVVSLKGVIVDFVVSVLVVAPPLLDAGGACLDVDVIVFSRIFECYILSEDNYCMRWRDVHNFFSLKETT